LKPVWECRILKGTLKPQGGVVVAGFDEPLKMRASCETSGFTLLELTVVMVISALVLGFAGLSFGEYYKRTAAQNAAQVFVQDLRLARTWAVRSQEGVVIRFAEDSLSYEVETMSTSTLLAKRRFGTNADIELSAVTLDIKGDSLIFSSRGIADMGKKGGALGTATFSSGATTYTVSFNTMGASKVEQS